MCFMDYATQILTRTYGNYDNLLNYIRKCTPEFLIAYVGLYLKFNYLLN